MSKATTVAVAGGALILVNVWTTSDRTALGDVLNGNAKAQAAAHSVLLKIGAEALAILVATIAAGSSDAVGNGMIAAVAALWVLWAINYYASRPVPGSPGKSAVPGAAGGDFTRSQAPNFTGPLPTN